MIILEKLKDESFFTDVEINIVHFILEDPQKVINATIDELARMSYSSPSSIVRLAKKLGFKGYSDFKIKLAVEINTFLINHTRIEIDMPVINGASNDEIAQNLMNLHNQALLSVYHELDLKLMQDIADLFWDSDILFLRGVGPSLLIAQDFYYKLRRLGKNIDCVALTGFETQLFVEDDRKKVILVVSQYATSILIRNLLLESKALNYKVVLLTLNHESPLVKLADYPLVLSSGEHNRMTKMGHFASRTAMNFVLDILYTMIFMKDYDCNVKRLYDFSVRNSKRDVYINELNYFSSK